MVLGSGRFWSGRRFWRRLLRRWCPPRPGRNRRSASRVGRSIDPEQGYVGVFYRSPGHRRPLPASGGLDGGFGRNLRLGIINIDFVYLLPARPGPLEVPHRRRTDHRPHSLLG